MKVLRALFYTVCFCIIFMTPAHAYVDPSVTTFAIQAVVGAAVVVSAVAGVWWRKVKKKAMKTLNIDENAGKKREDDLVVFDEEKKPGDK